MPVPLCYILVLGTFWKPAWQFHTSTDVVKENVEAVQDYSLLAGRSLSNLFAGPATIADTLAAG